MLDPSGHMVETNTNIPAVGLFLFDCKSKRRGCFQVLVLEQLEKHPNHSYQVKRN